MRVTERTESRERCAEAGWYAFDFLLDEPMDRDFILSLRPLGSFVFLEMLARPFFKIESDNYVIKGILGDSFFRMAVYDGAKEELDRIEEWTASIDRTGRK